MRQDGSRTASMSSLYSKSSAVFCRAERGSLKYTGRQTRVRSLPTHSLIRLHRLTLFSFCAGLGRRSLLAGAGNSSLNHCGVSSLFQPSAYRSDQSSIAAAPLSHASSHPQVWQKRDSASESHLPQNKEKKQNIQGKG